jgi:hypothetical protein
MLPPEPRPAPRPIALKTQMNSVRDDQSPPIAVPDPDYSQV